MFREISPPLTVVIVARSEDDVLDAAVTVIVPLLEPEEGETVIHEAEPLLTVQLVLEETEKVFCSPKDEKLSEDVETVKLTSTPA